MGALTDKYEAILKKQAWHNKGTFDENSAVITDSVNQIDIQEFIEQSIHRTVNDDTPYDFGVLSAKAIKAIQKHTGLNLSGYSCKIYPSYVRHIKNRHPEQLVLLTKINNMLNSINYAIKEIGKNSKTGKTETYILLFTKQDENVIKLVKIRDYAKKELSIKTIHALDEADQKLPLSLRLSFDAIKPQTLRHYPKSDGFTHQKDDKSIIPKNTNQVNMDGAETMNIQELPHETVQMDMAFISTMLTNKELKEKETELKEKYEKASSMIAKSKIIKELSDLATIEEGAFSDVATKTAMKEIDDSEISFSLVPRNAKNLTVGDIMEAPLLFSKYPQLRNLKIKHLKSSSLHNGKYRPSENALYISPPDYLDEEREKEIDERFYSADAKYVKNVFGDYGTLNIVLFLKEESELSESALAKKRAYINFSNDLKKQKEKEKNRLSRTYERQKSVILHELQHAIQEIENWEKGGVPKNKSEKAYEEYRSLWGEQQARAAQHRMDMTKEEKQKESWQDTLKRVEKKYDNPIVKLNHGNSAVITDSITFDMAPHRHHIAEKMIGIPQEIEKFGRNFTKFKGKPIEAIEHLIKVKNGQVRGAIHKEGIGDIDFIWGKILNPKKHTGYGLAHIIDKHGAEVARKLPKMINSLPIKNKTSNGVILEDTEQAERVSIQLKYIKKSKIWVLTAYNLDDDSSVVGDTATSMHLIPTLPCNKVGASKFTQIIPKNTNQVNMDGAETMNILQQIKTETGLLAKKKLLKQWRSLGLLQRKKALKEYGGIRKSCE
ncbi:MAG: hypothetical protein QG567_663 [Campylobacterota bacterium]|nr:hypothetical protein [Campylobacterota bacterium]